MAQEAYIFVSRLKLDDPLQDKLTMDLNRTAAVQLKDLLARALNYLPEAEWRDWYALSDKLEQFAKESPLQVQPQDQGELF